VLEKKRLGGLLTVIRESQQSEPPDMRSNKGPKRRVRRSTCSAWVDPWSLFPRVRGGTLSVVELLRELP
jgi:hypothetical protein